ncbi:hypothetical protein PMAYCL1PPCAC_15350, partial [Pristionchus mayeri]
FISKVAEMGIILIVMAFMGWNLHDLIYFIGVATIVSQVWPFLPGLRDKLIGKKPKELNEENPEKDFVYLFQKRNTLTSRGSNHQLPFIELNGETISDSQLILRRLKEMRNLHVYPDEQTAAVGHAIDRMLDNHTFNHNVHAKLDKLSGMVGIVARTKVPSIFLPPLSAPKSNI